MTVNAMAHSTAMGMTLKRSMFSTWHRCAHTHTYTYPGIGIVSKAKIPLPRPHKSGVRVAAGSLLSHCLCERLCGTIHHNLSNLPDSKQAACSTVLHELMLGELTV